MIHIRYRHREREREREADRSVPKIEFLVYMSHICWRYVICILRSFKCERIGPNCTKPVLLWGWYPAVNHEVEKNAWDATIPRLRQQCILRFRHGMTNASAGLACWCRRIHTPRGPGRMMNGRYLLATRRNMGSIGIPAGLGYLFLNMTTWINWTRPSEILAATRFLDVLSIRHAILLEWVCCQWWPKTWGHLPGMNYGHFVGWAFKPFSGPEISVGPAHSKRWLLLFFSPWVVIDKFSHYEQYDIPIGKIWVPNIFSLRPLSSR